MNEVTSPQLTPSDSIPAKQAMTVDVEDYFHVSAFEKNIAKK